MAFTKRSGVVMAVACVCATIAPSTAFAPISASAGARPHVLNRDPRAAVTRMAVSVAPQEGPRRPWRSAVVTKMAEVASGGDSAATSADRVDKSEVAKYWVATLCQWGVLVGIMKGLDILQAVKPGLVSNAGVGVLFAFLSLRSRVFSVLNNSRPKRRAAAKEMELATPTEAPRRLRRPSWTPPGIAFPFIWGTITVLRGVSSAVVFSSTQSFFTPAFAAMLLHLSIGDTWNTITNIEKRLGVSAVVAYLVAASVYTTTYLYYLASPLAGYLLAPSALWLTVATSLCTAIWRINSPLQPLYPVPSDNKASALRFEKYLKTEEEAKEEGI